MFSAPRVYRDIVEAGSQKRQIKRKRRGRGARRCMRSEYNSTAAATRTETTKTINKGTGRTQTQSPRVQYVRRRLPRRRGASRHISNRTGTASI